MTLSYSALTPSEDEEGLRLSAFALHNTKLV